jgi:hypothetical protein
VPQVVELPALPRPAAVAPLAESFTSRCRVDGMGEVGSAETPDLAVRETPTGLPIFVVSARAKVHVTWSNLPPPSNEPGRWAAVELGGQAHVRGRGYADLYGRVFQIHDDAPIIGEQVWVRGGAQVELLGEDARGVHVGISSFALPGRHLRGATTCANVLYQPEALEMKEPQTGTSVAMSGSTLHLRASPGGAALLDLQRNDEDGISLMQLGQSPGYVHVTGVAGRVGFDGWVANAEVVPDTLGTLGSIGTHGYGTSGGGSRNLRTVRVDAPLRVGVAGHSRATHVMIEKGARVYVGAQNQPEEPGLVSVDFEDGWIAPPGSDSFWIPEVTLD